MKNYTVTVNGKEFDVGVEETTYGAPSRESGVLVPRSADIDGSPKRPETPNAAVNGKKVMAPMPGTVLKIKAPNGSRVTEGDAIIVLEAMKMENEIIATKSGRVDVRVAEGDKINSGDLIAIIE